MSILIGFFKIVRNPSNPVHNDKKRDALGHLFLLLVYWRMRTLQGSGIGSEEKAKIIFSFSSSEPIRAHMRPSCPAHQEMLKAYLLEYASKK